MRTHSPVRLFAVLTATTLLATACSANDDASSTDAAKKVTIASLLGAPDYSTIDYDAQQQKMEELVATCMADEGWEYTPVQYPDSGTSVEYSDEDEVARIEREGFGLTYYLLNDGEGGGIVDDPWTDFVDPNQEYVTTLSESEQAAYYGSLYGTEEEQAAASTTQIDPDTGEEYTTITGNLGCQGEAYDAVYGDDPTQSPAFQDAMNVYYAELGQRAEADPRLLKLNEDWSACMSDAGYDYENTQAFYDGAYTKLQARVDDVLGPDFYSDPTAGWSPEKIDEFYATATEAEINALYDQSNTLSDDQRTQLEAILADEIAIALAEHGCSKVLNDKGQEIYADIEEQYALEHEDELKALAASLASEG